MKSYESSVNFIIFPFSLPSSDKWTMLHSLKKKDKLRIVLSHHLFLSALICWTPRCVLWKFGLQASAETATQVSANIFFSIITSLQNFKSSAEQMHLDCVLKGDWLIYHGARRTAQQPSRISDEARAQAIPFWMVPKKTTSGFTAQREMQTPRQINWHFWPILPINK